MRRLLTHWLSLYKSEPLISQNGYKRVFSYVQRPDTLRNDVPMERNDVSIISIRSMSKMSIQCIIAYGCSLY